MQINQRREYFLNIFQKANKLIVFREILEDKILAKAIRLSRELSQDTDTNKIEALYYEICADLFKANIKIFEGLNLWETYFINLLACQENTFTLNSEKKGTDIEQIFITAAAHDMTILEHLISYKWELISANSQMFFDLSVVEDNAQKNSALKCFKDILISNTAQDKIKKLAEYYYCNGSGRLGLFNAFKWVNDKGLTAIQCPDTVSFDNLIGYDTQKEVLISNTEAFLCDKPANNILLFGDRGTGKSSSVKALINKYKNSKLRLIEVTKHQLIYFNEILNAIRDRNLRFIIFIDDLSFEDFETEYKYLKAIIEGGIESKPENVLIYATSNRRHLIKETWADRDKNLGDIHASDTMQEKLSLVDRFGITITFITPDQENYLKIVQGLAEQHGIILPANEIKEKALQWALWHNGRSGRTAKQFINHLIGEI